MFSSFARFAQKVIDRWTPYPDLCHFVTAKDPTSQLALKVTSFCLSLFSLGTLTLGLRLFCHWRFKDHEVVLRTPTEVEGPMQHYLAVVRGTQQPLNVKAMELSNELDDCLALGMENYTAVCPYKPCGYTEFSYSSLAQNGRKRADHQQRLKALHSCVPSFVQEHKMDNETTTKGVEGAFEFWAAHPGTIYELCLLNENLLVPGHTKPSAQLKALIQELKQALRAAHLHQVAQKFMELAQIENGLPLPLFQAAFGDINELAQGTFVQLPPSLEALIKLKRKYPKHDLRTLRNLAAYFYHEGFENPLVETERVLQQLEPTCVYIVKDHRLYQVPQGGKR